MGKTIMKGLQAFWYAGLIMPLAWACGCGGPADAPVSAGPKTVQVRQLPELADLVGPLDSGRLEAARPQGWLLPPRSSEYIVRFKASPRTSYPTILVTAEDYEPVFNCSEDNVDEFARMVAEHFEETGQAGKLAEEITPLQVGRRWGISYARRARVKQMIVDRLFFETVVSGRKYSFELRALKGSLPRFRPYLLAVVAGVKFLDTGAEPPETPPSRPADQQPQTQPEEEDPFAQTPGPWNSKTAKRSG